MTDLEQVAPGSDHMVDAVAERVARIYETHAREAWAVKDVALITGLSERTIWIWSEAGTFPCPRQRGRRKFWLAREVRDWLRKSPKAS